MKIISERDYVNIILDMAREIWGKEETEKICQHIESTASAVWKISQIHIDVKTEPAIKLRPRETI